MEQSEVSSKSRLNTAKQTAMELDSVVFESV